MNTSLVTTGLFPLTIGSVETFIMQGFLDGLPWQEIQGGTVSLIVADPAGNQTTYAAAISGSTAKVNYAIAAPVGNWTRCWSIVDSLGRVQRSRPIVFTVMASP
jgi:hypothetical protein